MFMRMCLCVYAYTLWCRSQESLSLSHALNWHSYYLFMHGKLILICWFLAWANPAHTHTHIYSRRRAHAPTQYATATWLCNWQFQGLHEVEVEKWISHENRIASLRTKASCYKADWFASDSPWYTLKLSELIFKRFATLLWIILITQSSCLWHDGYIKFLAIRLQITF